MRKGSRCLSVLLHLPTRTGAVARLTLVFRPTPPQLELARSLIFPTLPLPHQEQSPASQPSTFRILPLSPLNYHSGP